METVGPTAKGLAWTIRLWLVMPDRIGQCKPWTPRMTYVEWNPVPGFAYLTKVKETEEVLQTKWNII